MERDEVDGRQPGIRLSRRAFLTTGSIAAAATVPVLAAATAAPAPAAAAVGYDPRQRFVRLIGGGNGVIYAIQADGRLLWYRNLGWATSSPSWANAGTARQIGTGWAMFETVLAGADGTIFAMRGNGDLLWYRYVVADWTTGRGSWAARSGSRIGTGFTKFPRLFGGYDNIIWGIDPGGSLYRYQYLRNDGLVAPGAWLGGTRVGNGWNTVADAVADTGGVIYAQNGSLRWYRYVDGRWATGTGRTIASGWSDGAERTMVCAGAGALYKLALDTGAVPNLDDKLIAYRLTNHTTVGTLGARWYIANGRQVGAGFTFARTAALQGYATTLDVQSGGTAAFAVSTTFPDYRASVLRLAPGTEPVVVRDPVTVSGGLRTLPADYRTAGCRWPDSFTVDIPADWPSGLYAARLEGPGGLRRDVPFTVRPAAPSATVAVLLPTFTYLAYNLWNGHNQYTVGESGRQRAMSLLAPQHRFAVSATGQLDHTWWSDQLLMRWMSREGIAFDLFEEHDLHLSGEWLLDYQTLVLPTHPEYWTEPMRANLVSWLGTGGRLIYTGGNGIFERIVFDPATATVTFRRPSDGARDVYREAGLPESQIFGVAYDSRSYGKEAPYVVVRDHPLFADTGLGVGATFGTSGYNGAAAGWEADGRLGLDGDALPEEVIAEGLVNPRSSMVFMERPNGGFVFSAGSLRFNGALDRDPRMSRLLHNVFDRALAPNARQLDQPPSTARPEPVPPVEFRGEENANP